MPLGGADLDTLICHSPCEFASVRDGFECTRGADDEKTLGVDQRGQNIDGELSVGQLVDTSTASLTGSEA